MTRDACINLCHQLGVPLNDAKLAQLETYFRKVSDEKLTEVIEFFRKRGKKLNRKGVSYG